LTNAFLLCYDAVGYATDVISHTTNGLGDRKSIWPLKNLLHVQSFSSGE